jgi:hypothetical protein
MSYLYVLLTESLSSFACTCIRHVVINAGGYRGQRLAEKNEKKSFQLDRAVPDPKGTIVFSLHIKC